MHIYAPLIVALILSTVFTRGAMYLFPRWGLLDNPKKYGLIRAAIPYFGGLAIVATVIIATFIFLPLTRPVLALLMGSTLLAFVSFIDDKRGLPPLLRLGVQIVAAGVLLIGGVGIDHITNPLGGVISLVGWDIPLHFLGGEYHIALLGDVLVIGWVVLLVNAVNWLDGVAGGSSSLSGLAALAIFFLAAREGYHYFDQSAVIALAGITAGAALAFAVWNIAPPKILLGDTGSMLLGYLISALAIFSGGKIATAALVLGIPIFDAIFVSMYRLRRGYAPWRGGEWDRDRTPIHLHHRLIAIGMSERQVLAIFVGISTVICGVALAIDTTMGKVFALVGLIIAMIVGNWWLEKKRSRATTVSTHS